MFGSVCSLVWWILLLHILGSAQSTSRQNDRSEVDGPQPTGRSFIDDGFLRSCKQTYGQEVVDNIKASWHKSSACLEKVFYPDDRGSLMTRILTASTATPVHHPSITSLCNSHIPDIEKCSQSFIAALEGCTGVALGAMLRRAMSSALNYVCQDDGDRIVDFVLGGGPACLKDPHGSKMQECFRNQPDPFASEMRGNVSVSPKATCRMLEQRMRCAADVFQMCTTPHSAARHIVQGLMNTVMNETKCSDSSSSNGSGGNVDVVNEGRSKLQGGVGRLLFALSQFCGFILGADASRDKVLVLSAFVLIFFFCFAHSNYVILV